MQRQLARVVRLWALCLSDPSSVLFEEIVGFQHMA